MKTYFIEDSEGYFWCQHDIGYWSKFDSSKDYMFKGILLWVLPLYLMMRISRVKAKLKTLHR